LFTWCELHNGFQSMVVSRASRLKQGAGVVPAPN
jgi:hypothetical protein